MIETADSSCMSSGLEEWTPALFTLVERDGCVLCTAERGAVPALPGSAPSAPGLDCRRSAAHPPSLAQRTACELLAVYQTSV